MSLINYLARVHFADHVLEDALPEEIRSLGVRRAFVLRDAESALQEFTDRLEDALPHTVTYVAISVPKDAQDAARTTGQRAALSEALRLFRAKSCDCIIAMGGVAALDMARLLIGRIAQDRAPALIAVPTTITSVGIGPLSWPTTATGRGVGTSMRPVPTVILCDPTLTLHSDAGTMAASGLDTLAHCIESYLSATYNPPADGIALEGVRRVAAHLEHAIADAEGLAPRRELLAATLCAGLAAEKGLGAAEAIARALEAEIRPQVQHGRFHAAVLPHVLMYNAPAVGDRFKALTQALGVPKGQDIPEALGKLGNRLGLPVRLNTTGLTKQALRRAARTAVTHHANRTNPRHATAQNYYDLLSAAL